MDLLKLRAGGYGILRIPVCHASSSASHARAKSGLSRANSAATIPEDEIAGGNCCGFGLDRLQGVYRAGRRRSTAKHFVAHRRRFRPTPPRMLWHASGLDSEPRPNGCPGSALHALLHDCAGLFSQPLGFHGRPSRGNISSAPETVATKQFFASGPSAMRAIATSAISLRKGRSFRPMNIRRSSTCLESPQKTAQ